MWPVCTELAALFRLLPQPPHRSAFVVCMHQKRERNRAEEEHKCIPAFTQHRRFPFAQTQHSMEPHFNLLSLPPLHTALQLYRLFHHSSLTLPVHLCLFLHLVHCMRSWGHGCMHSLHSALHSHQIQYPISHILCNGSTQQPIRG